MDEDTIADLKQFIATTVSQQTSDLHGDIKGVKEDIKKLDDKLSDRIDKLSDKIDDVNIKLDTIANTVGERFEDSTAKTTTKLDDHEVRITKLEHKPA